MSIKEKVIFVVLVFVLLQRFKKFIGQQRIRRFSYREILSKFESETLLHHFSSVSVLAVKLFFAEFFCCIDIFLSSLSMPKHLLTR